MRIKAANVLPVIAGIRDHAVGVHSWAVSSYRISRGEVEAVAVGLWYESATAATGVLNSARTAPQFYTTCAQLVEGFLKNQMGL